MTRTRTPEPQRRLSMRWRLTISYAGLVTGTGAVLIGIVYLFMRYVPDYSFTGGSGIPTMEGAPEHLPEEIKELIRQAGGAVQDASQVAVVKIMSTEQLLASLLLVSLVALGLLAILSGAAGWFLARRTLRPLAAINSAAQQASDGDYAHRINLRGPADEISGLAHSFDRMLDSVEGAFAAQQRFAHNASHELQTPLATVQTMIEVTPGDADAEQLRALVDRIREVNRASIDTVNALLDLADAENGDLHPERFDLAAQARSAIAELDAVAAERLISVAGPDGRLEAHGDPVLLKQALSNLVRNAIIHNVPGGHVEVRTELLDDGGAALVVVNSGPRVPEDALHRLTAPFARAADRTRTGAGSGHGLGLAIISAVAAAHRARLELRANPGGGLTVRLELGPELRSE